MPQFSEQAEQFSFGVCRDADLALGAAVTDGGVRFSVWAPDARRVSVIGSFNSWLPGHDLQPVASTGVWTGIIPTALPGDLYKFRIEMPDGSVRDKADPFARAAEIAPGDASRIVDFSLFQWYDSSWIAHRRGAEPRCNPIRVLRANPAGAADLRALRDSLLPDARSAGYSHIRLSPLPCDEAGQPAAFFAPDARLGDPFELMQTIDACHRSGLGVQLSLNPFSFSMLPAGLGLYNGRPLFENGVLPDRTGCRFRHSSAPVRNFLASCVAFWLRVYHIDGFHFTVPQGFLPDAAELAAAADLCRIVRACAPGALLSADFPCEGADFRTAADWAAETAAAFAEPARSADRLAALADGAFDRLLPLPQSAADAALLALWQAACPGAALRSGTDTPAAARVLRAALTEPALWQRGTCRRVRTASDALMCIRRTGLRPQDEVFVLLNLGNADACAELPVPAGRALTVAFAADPDRYPEVPYPASPEEGHSSAITISVPAASGCVLRVIPEANLASCKRQTHQEETE